MLENRRDEFASLFGLTVGRSPTDALDLFRCALLSRWKFGAAARCLLVDDSSRWRSLAGRVCTRYRVS